MSFLVVHRSLLRSSLAAALLMFLFASSDFAQDPNARTDHVKAFHLAQDAHEKGDLQTALKFYEQAIGIEPDFPEAEYQRGAVFVALGKLNEAEKAFRRAIEIKNDWVLPLTDLGTVLISTRRFAEAEKVLNQALLNDQQYAPALVALTELRLRSKASPEVLQALLDRLRVLTSQPEPPASIWASSGALERALGDDKAALKSLSEALAREPTNYFALSERIEIYLDKKSYALAIDDAQTIVKRAPGSANARMRLAQIYAANGNFPQALNVLGSLDASDAEVVSLTNSIKASTTDDVSELEKYLAADGKNVAVLARLCRLTRASNPQKSLDYCRRASDAEPGNLDHAIGFGAALVQARQFDNAITLFNRILTIAPGNFAVHANLATALFESKRFPEAKAEYMWLIKDKPDLAIAYYFLAITNDQMGEYAEALISYQRFLQIAGTEQNQLEIDKVNLRLPSLRKLVKQKGKKQ